VAERRRPRFRYVVFLVKSEARLTEQSVSDAVFQQLPNTSLKLILFDGTRGIVRCTNRTKDETIAALNAMNNVGKREVLVRTIGTSGTIRKARLKFLR